MKKALLKAQFAAAAVFCYLLSTKRQTDTVTVNIGGVDFHSPCGQNYSEDMQSFDVHHRNSKNLFSVFLVIKDYTQKVHYHYSFYNSNICWILIYAT